MVVGDFRKAVCICGGEDISSSVIDAVYTIFDVDGDGHLSTEEFISIMKSRLKRGIRVCHHVRTYHMYIHGYNVRTYYMYILCIYI